MASNEGKKRITVTLDGGKPWGFRIIGGNDMSISLQVQQVLSTKAKSVGLEKGDKIFEINGKSTTNISHNEAKSLIVDSGNSLKLVIEKNTTQFPASQKNSLSAEPSNDSRGMLSVPSRTMSSSMSNRGSTTSSEIRPPAPKREPPKKVDIKPKIKLGEDTNEEKIAYEKYKNEEKEKQQMRQSNNDVDECTGLSRTGEVKSPFLKNLIVGGVDNRSEQQENVVNVKPPTAHYTPPPPQTNIKQSSVTTHTKPKIDIDTNQHPKSIMSDGDTKKCSKCNDVITDSSYISASNRYFHKTHFICEHCGNTLVGKAYFEDKDNKICCQLCANKGSSGQCKKCNKPILGSFLTVGKDCYHDECFVCSNCKKSLRNEQFILSDGCPWCEGCHEQENSTFCVKCKKPIKPGESFVEVENGNCHSMCFTCKICKSVLTSFKMRDGYAICPKH